MVKWLNCFSVFFILVLIFLLLPKSINADNLSGSNYSIQFGNISIGGAPASSSNYKIYTSLGQTAAQQFSSSGYIVRAGIKYLYSIAPFSFSLSTTNINLGSLTPNSFSNQTTDLTVSFNSAQGYQVTAIETDKMKTFGGVNNILDTNCDVSCSISAAGTWATATNNGFGYNMGNLNGNTDVPTDFSASNKFRPFANAANGDSPQIVMSASPNTSSNLYHNSNRKSRMTFQISVSGAQVAGTYQTVIKFTTTPKY